MFTSRIGGTRGPLDLSLKHQNYLVENIRDRYMFSPYYYTMYFHNQLNQEPLLRPLVYDFHEASDLSSTASIVSQFMIGPALMAAPIISSGMIHCVYASRSNTQMNYKIIMWES